MEGIINILVEKDFFDKRCYEERHVLTSAEIQKIWLDATKRRKRELTPLPYLLIEKGNDTKAEADHKPEKRRRLHTKSKNYMQSANISPENADNSKQSKVEQSIAVKEEESPVGGAYF